MRLVVRSSESLLSIAVGDCVGKAGRGIEEESQVEVKLAYIFPVMQVYPLAFAGLEGLEDGSQP